MSDPNNEILHLLHVYHEKKIKELEGCFENERKELEDNVGDLRKAIEATKTEADRMDDAITKGKQREDNIDQIRKLWNQRKQDFVRAQNQLEGQKENVVNSFQDCAKNAKKQLLNQVEDCSSCSNQEPPAAVDLPEIQEPFKDGAKATKETEFSFEALKKLKDDNDKLLDKLLLVRAKILTSSNPGVEQKHLAGEEKRLENENWMLKEQIKAISGRLERGSVPTSKHLDELEQTLICLLEKNVRKMEWFFNYNLFSWLELVCTNHYYHCKKMPKQWMIFELLFLFEKYTKLYIWNISLC